MSCDHTLQEISLRKPDYPNIDRMYELQGVINPRLPTYTVDCVCIQCGKWFLVDQDGNILKELADEY